MDINNLLLENLNLEASKTDLRSAKNGSWIQRGSTVRFIRVLSLIVIDVLALTIAWQLAIHYGTPLESLWTQKLSFILLTIVIKIAIIASRGLYKAGSSRRNYIALFKAISLSVLIDLLIAFLYEPNNYVSRSTFILFWIASLSLVCTGRFLFEIVTDLVRKRGLVTHPILLITEPENQKNHICLLQKENYYNILGVNEPGSLDLLEREKTFNYLSTQGITEVFVSWDAIQNRLYLCWHFQNAGITLRILPMATESCCPRSTFQMIGDIPCMTLPTRVIIGVDFWVKRCFDLVCSVIALVLLSPIYLIIAIIIKLDSPGSVFFRQSRIGLHGKEFKIWKFRTMVVDAEKLQSSLETKNEVKDGVMFKMKNDPRITQFGTFLRRYSLDELPQLFNVFLGEMSLVGPRPFPMRDVERFHKSHFIRQEVLPGITGLWQVSGRSEIDSFEEAVKLDISYIENWSFWLDIEILLKTVEVVFRKTGAY